MSPAAGISTVLFVPGSRPERFEKALASGADVVCIDLEDAVAANAKGDARSAAMQALAAGNSRLSVRINGLATEHGLRDLLAIKEAGTLPPLLFIPMVESVRDIAIARSVLGIATQSLVPLIETTAALRVAHEIARAEGVAAMMFGGGDLSAELGVELAWEPLAAARGQFVLACAALGIGLIDVPFIHLQDEDGLAEETAKANRLGFTAKAAIHPNQVPAIQRVFRPTEADVAEAREAIEAYRAAGGKAISHQGRMLEAPVIRRYEAILSNREKLDA